MRRAPALVSALLGAMLVGCTLPTALTTVKPTQATLAGQLPVDPGEVHRIVLPPGWAALVLPGLAPGVDVVAFHRHALAQPARYQVLVIPGSGCTRWAPLVEHYFAGLLHADVVVLHKPHVDVMADPKAPCTAAFIATDSLASWRDAATAAVAALPQGPKPALPQVVVGISEGAELLPELASSMPAVAAVVMVSASGMDPVTTGSMQAKRRGHSDAWQALQAAVKAPVLPDDWLVQGRTLRYWRTFWQWSLAEPLLSAPWPLLRIWGDEDEAVPPAAYLQFSSRASSRKAPYCDIRLPGADHGLQTSARDGIQWLWGQLERWARQSEKNICDVAGAP